MNTPRIAVTGIGLVSPLGQDKHQAWRRLMDGEGGIEALGGEGHQPTIPAARLGDFQASRWLNKLQMVGTERVSQMALGAARLAMDDAGLGAAFGDPERAGLYLGTGMGGAATVDAGYAALHAGRHLPPLTVPTGMVNNAAAIVAMHAHVGGPVLTFSVACASSAIAIAEAAHALRRGEIDVALAGGSEALLVRGSIAAWRALHTLAPLHASDVRDSCRP
ncbi:MAG TPA: beta-ketoacyl synthase N-terminal-like domain-containing protein, partial [Methylibium sp.]